MNQTDAYMAAYTTCKNRETAKANASRLLTNANIKARLDYRRARLARKLEITLEGQLKKYEETGVKALSVGEFSAARACWDSQSKLCQIGGFGGDDNSSAGKTLVEILALVGRKRVESRELNHTEKLALEPSKIIDAEPMESAEKRSITRGEGGGNSIERRV
jgi:hypothetical protein